MPMTSTKNFRLSSGFGVNNSMWPRWARSKIGSDVIGGLSRRFHGAVSMPFPVGLGFHTRTIGESDASIDHRHAHRRALWHNFRCNRTESEDLAGDAAQPGPRPDLASDA